MALRPPFPLDLPFSMLSDLRSLASSAAKLVGRLDGTDATLEQLLDTLAPVGEELGKLRRVGVALQGQVASNEQQLKAVEGQFASTERQMSTLEREIAGLQATVTSLQDDIHHIQERVPGLKPPDER